MHFSAPTCGLTFFTHLIEIIQYLYFVNGLNLLARASAVTELFLRSVLGKIVVSLLAEQNAQVTLLE